MFIPLFYSIGRKYRLTSGILLLSLFAHQSVFSDTNVIDDSASVDDLLTSSSIAQPEACVFPDNNRVDKVRIVGEAKSIASEDKPSRLIYCEYHFFNQGGVGPSNKVSQVEYYTPEGSLIAKKTVDFSLSEFAPNVYQEDARHGELRLSERVLDKDAYRLFYLPADSDKDAGQEMVVAAAENMVVDAGFDNAIRAQWDQILSGKKVKYVFLAAPSLRTFGLKVRKIKSSACEQWFFDEDSQVCLRVSSTSGFINLFIKPITLIYERASKRLVVFNGTVNLSTDKGTEQRANIRYYYQ